MVDIEKIVEQDETIILKKFSFPIKKSDLNTILKFASLDVEKPVSKEAITFILDDKYVILINTSSFYSQNRYRFTLAHEYAHIKLDHLSEERRFVFQDELSRSGLDEIEREANSYAAEFLMPKDKIDELQRQGKNFSEIAWELRVSEEALTHRLNKIGYMVK